MNNPIGQTLLNQYRVDAFIGAGGMSTVYKAYDLKRSVYLAMKVLHADLADDPSVFKLFQREARALQKLAHPNIVPFYGIYQDQGFTFLLERYVDGPSLKGVLRQRQSIPVPETLAYLKAMCAALGYAHVNGVVHCDVKPGNVMVDRGGTVYMTDFGVARHAESTTTTLATAGTPAYMAPEQIRGEAVSAETDIYALGIVLYEMLTGRRPFLGDERDSQVLGSSTGERVRYAQMNLPPENPRVFNPAIPEALAQVILRALVKRPEGRYKSTLELYNAAVAASSTDPTQVADRVPVIDERGVPVDVPPVIGDPKTPPDPSKDNIREYIPWLVGVGGVAVVLCIFVVIIFDIGPRIRSIIGGPAIPAPTDSVPTFSVGTTAPSVLITDTPSPTLSPTSTHKPSTTPTGTPELTPTDTVEPTPVTTPLGGGGLIAFQSDRSGNNDIYVINADGSGFDQLTDETASETVPSWSPDGKEIAYQSIQDGDWEIFVVTLATKRARQITHNNCDDFAPSWSPDGRRFIFYSDCAGGRQLYMVDVNGSNRQQITEFSGVWSVFPSWSPDGSQITYSSNKPGKYYVYTMNIDGSSMRQLERGCISSFSPDGKYITFGQYCFETGEIYYMKADGSDRRTLDKKFENKNPSWSRDGKRIVFQSERDGSMDIWTMDLDGEDWIQLTSGSSFNAAPVWQPKIR